MMIMRFAVGYQVFRLQTSLWLWSLLSGGNYDTMEKERGLTRVRTKGQRGLETPSAEVGRGSLKDERHRQGDKHDPLSSGFSWEFCCGSSSFFFISLLNALRVNCV